MTVEEVARTAVGAVDSSDSFALACQWVAERYQQLVSRAKFKFLRRVGEVVIPAAYQTGTATVTKGSSVVMGTGVVWSPTYTGWYFKSGKVWHEIAGANDPGLAILTLVNPFTDEDVTDGAYTLVNKKVLLDPSARWIADRMVQMNTGRPISRFSQLEMTMKDPSRPEVGPDPTTYIESGIDPNTGARQFEFYPYTDHNVLVGYVYWADPPVLTSTDSIPFHIDPYILKEGCLIDLMRYMQSRAAHEGKVDVAGFWRNEARAQETIWERRVQEAIHTDTGTSDTALILALGSSGNQSTTSWGV